MVIFDILSIFVSYVVLDWFWRKVMARMAGWFTIYINPQSYIIMAIALYAAYFIISLIDFNRIKKIPLSEALKNVE